MGGKNTDYGQVADVQGDANQQAINSQLYANRPTQYTPWGSSSWTTEQSIDPATGEPITQWSNTTSLTPELQTLLNKQLAIQGGKTDIAGAMTGRLGSEYGSGMDWRGLRPMGKVPTNQFVIPENTQGSLDYSGAPGVGDMGVRSQYDYSNAPGVGDPNAIRQHSEDAIYGKAASRLDGQFESKRADLETKMRNQGLGPEDAAWKSQMQALGQQSTDAYGQAQYDAVTGGMGEANQMYNQQMGLRNMATGEAERQGNFYNQGSNQALQQQMALRGMATGEVDRRSAFYNQAAQQRYNQASGAIGQNFGQQMNAAQFANQMRQQDISERMTMRGQGLNEINALLSGGQVGMPQMPNFQNSGYAEPGNYMQAAAQNQSQQNANNPWAAILGMGGQALGGWATNW